MTHGAAERPDYIESHASLWERLIWLRLAERLALWWPWWLGDLTRNSLIDRLKLKVYADGWFWEEIQLERRYFRGKP